MHDFTPIVTVFIPTFNRLSSLQQAVTSVLNQPVPLRLHVLDNCSHDGTQAWLNKVAKDDGRVQLTFRDGNVGAITNFVDGFQSVVTPYFVPLADDDLLEPDFLPTALQVVEEEQNLGAVIFKTLGVHNNKVITISPEQCNIGCVQPYDHLKTLSSHGHYLSWSSVLWSTRVAKPFGASKTMLQFGLLSDVWFQFRVFIEAPVYFVSQPGSRFNFHENQSWRRIGPPNLWEFGLLAAELERLLTDKQFFNKQEITVFISQLSVNWNRFIRTVSEQRIGTLPEADLRLGVQAYLELFYPRLGFSAFPFGQILDAQTKALSQKRVDEV